MIKALLIGLILVAIVEGWVIYRLSNVENQVLMPSAYFSKIDPQFADTFYTATGSWISDTKLANPAQTIELACYKNFGYCIESIAQISENNFLNVSTDLHEIDSWTAGAITTKPKETAAGCVEYTIKIDRINQRVTSTRMTKNNKTSLCQVVGDEPIILHLGDGLDRLNKIKSQPNSN